MAQFQTLQASLARSSALSEFTKHLEFVVKGIPHFGFVPGQWLSLKTSKPDGEEITRAYSIASASAGYLVYRDRHWDRSLSLDAALAAGRPVTPSRTSVLAVVRRALRAG